MYYTKHNDHYIHERKEQDNALVTYALIALALTVLAPVIVYFYHVLSDSGLKVVVGLGALFLFSHVFAKLIYHFIEHFDAPGEKGSEDFNEIFS